MLAPLSIAPYTVHLLESGRFGLDGGAMFGSVPKALWQRSNPSDEANRIALALRHLLIEGDGRLILIDTGMGGGLSQKQREMFAIDQPGDPLGSALASAGFSREQVTDVILTHLHFDHAGGATLEEHGEWVPAFPNATYYTQAAQWELANAPSAKDKASFLPHQFLPLRQHGRLEILAGPEEVIPGLELLVGNGHTDGHQMVKLSGAATDGGSSTMVFLGDTIPTTTHLRLPFIMGYDLRPLETLQEKKSLLAQAADEGWWLFFDHDPQVPGVRIGPGAKDYEIVERYGAGD